MEQREYVRRVLDAYCATPGTVGVIRRSDRLFALQLHERLVPLDVIENAMTLAAARRLARPDELLPWAQSDLWLTSLLSSTNCFNPNPAQSTSGISAYASPSSNSLDNFTNHW